MPEVTIVYWRDIPAQVIIGKGRRGTKRILDERFEQAIDRCAMKVGARSDDAYLAEWRKAEPFSVSGDDTTVADDIVSKLHKEYPPERLKELIKAEGRDPKAG